MLIIDYMNKRMEKMMRADEERMFGMSKEDIREEYMESLTAKFSGQEMVVASILSDCQEMLSLDYSEDAIRKQLNIAKFILFEMLDAKREAETMLVSSDGKEIV
jgi:hypothetical protein